MTLLVSLSAPLTPTVLTLVTGPSALKREEAIWLAIKSAPATSLQHPQRIIGVILEGLPDGKSGSGPTDPNVHIKRVAPGCLCCVGLLTLRVTLNRLLRDYPALLYISIADATHVDQIRTILTSAPYDAWLTVSSNINT
ncbi:GTPase [Glaciimonas sp. PAMC28666]|uniref:GTPase n=1 Tax=Glaciimonas sp. PAMC28666 TaxID=2807626 RepID=UPI001966A6C4|nr:GTPase [Glaciimonas sp. PAMC28666]QRX83765.1 GTPase [Glaciimonas sp. PAMC28666]